MAQSVSDGSDLPNPLADYYSLPFFSRSLNLSSSPPSILPNNPNPSFSDSLRAHLKARVLSSPDKILEQGTTILEGNVELLKADRSQAVSIENEKVPRERRPGLGLRRAKFSMRPMPSSQPEASLDFNVDFSKLSDPDEYFDAYERMEKAKKEVQRLKGEPIAKLDLNNVSLAPRIRRPSLLGRTATYTHRTYPSVSMAKVGETLLSSQETLLPSQETFDDDIVGPVHHDVVPDANIISNSSSNRVVDSKATTTSKASELDELLSLNYEGLDDEGVQNLLREKLQIKSVDIGDFSFPEWRVPLCEPMNTSTTLSMRNDILKHLNESKIAVRGKATKSPAKSRSPLASISLLNRHIEERIPSKDLFSFDSSPEKATNTTGELKRADKAVQSDKNDAMRNMLGEGRSPVHVQEDTAATGEDSLVNSETVVVQISEPVEKEVVVGQSDQICNRTELRENESSVVHGEENIFGCDVDPTNEPETQNNEQVDAARESVRQQLIFEALDTENSSLNGVGKGGMAEPSNAENISIEEFTQETVGSSDKKLEKEKEKSKAPSKSAVSKKPVKRGKQSETSQVDVPVAKETLSKRRKVEVAGPGQGKENRRHSLYNAGTKWDGGLRRSTRNRMRPLEFWKGERVLYGRVHESLVTVIGVKYGTKVESFVSDQYKDLIDLVSQ